MSNVRNIHFEAVGSYLRPAELKEARAKFADGKISATDLRCIEDRLITEVIRQQKAHRLPYITDGEFRRSYWHLDFMWGFNGVEHIELEHGYQFHGEETTKGSIQLTGKITGENHPFIKDFLFVKKFEELDAKGEYIFEAKQTVPAPAQFLAELFRGKNAENTRKFYPNTTQLIEDIAQAYRTFFQEIYAAGCPNHCPECHNPQSWDINHGTMTSTEELIIAYFEPPIWVTRSWSSASLPLFQPSVVPTR